MCICVVLVGVCAVFSGWPRVTLVAGLAVSVGLSVPAFYLEIITDPTELWAAPTSRSRIEKDYYDDQFGPFYRTEMLIIRAKGLEPVSKLLHLNVNVYILTFFLQRRSTYVEFLQSLGTALHFPISE